MKRIVLLTIVAIIGSISLYGQEVNNAHKEKQIKEKTQIQNEKQDTQGQAVSQTAKETPSDQGKGEVVSAAARSKGEAKKAVKAKKVKKEKKVKANKERQIEEVTGVQKEKSKTRPDTAAKGVVKGGAKPGKVK